MIRLPLQKNTDRRTREQNAKMLQMDFTGFLLRSSRVSCIMETHVRLLTVAKLI